MFNIFRQLEARHCIILLAVMLLYRESANTKLFWTTNGTTQLRRAGFSPKPTHFKDIYWLMKEFSYSAVQFPEGGG